MYHTQAAVHSEQGPAASRERPLWSGPRGDGRHRGRHGAGDAGPEPEARAARDGPQFPGRAGAGALGPSHRFTLTQVITAYTTVDLMMAAMMSVCGL